MTPMEKLSLDVMDLVGRSFGKYQIQGILGEGGMAIVYKAIHREFETPVAIKFLLPEFSRQENVRRRFRDEGRLQFKLRHPNLVRVLELVEEGSTIGMIMDYVDGHDVAHHLKEKKRPFTLQEIETIFLPVLSAVGYAHAQQIVHRDLKPSNILIERVGGIDIPRVMDFGIAKSLEDGSSQTKTGSFLGSPQYCSPEQISGEKSIDHRTDIYALGCTLYELLKTRPPYSNKGSLQKVLFAHICEEPPSFEPVYPGAGKKLDALFAKALAKDRDKRFATCEEFAKELAALIQNIKSLPPPKFETTLTGAELASGSFPSLAAEASTRLPLNEVTSGKGRSSRRFLALAFFLVLLGGGSFWFSGLRSTGDGPAKAPSLSSSLASNPPALPSKPDPRAPSGGTNPRAAGSVEKTPANARQPSGLALPRAAGSVEGRPTPSSPPRPPSRGGEEIQDAGPAAPSDDRKAPTNPALLRLTITSTPPKASVIQDDEILGETPLDIEGKEGEKRSLRLEAAGHKSKTFDIVFSKTQTSLPVSLEALRKKLPSKKEPQKRKVFEIEEAPL